MFTALSSSPPGYSSGFLRSKDDEIFTQGLVNEFGGLRSILHDPWVYWLTSTRTWSARWREEPGLARPAVQRIRLFLT
jgi:hypothetical protein